MPNNKIQNSGQVSYLIGFSGIGHIVAYIILHPYIVVLEFTRPYLTIVACEKYYRICR